MSLSKEYFESNEFEMQRRRSQNAANNRKKKNNLSPSPFTVESPEHLPLPQLIRLAWQRLRRNWVAFRFQVNRWTFGALKPRTLAQLAIAAATGFYFFGPESSPVFLPDNKASAQVWARETNLDVGPQDVKEKPPKKSKSTNEAAPVAADELLRAQSLDYIERYKKIARGEMEKYGIPASISLAQGLIESRAGTSKLAVNNNNHFGMKCFAKNCGKGHCSNFTDDSHKDFFRKFKSPWESWRAHSQLLASGRYARLKRHGRDYRAWANGLQSVGYATDRAYAKKLIGIIERYDLHQYDR